MGFRTCYLLTLDRGPFYDYSRPSWCMVQDGPEEWRGMRPIGGISHLFVRVSDASEGTLSQIGLCFPNLVYLQIEVPSMTETGNVLSHEPFWDVAQALPRFKTLKTLALHCKPLHYPPWWISPGEQHHFVHDIYQGCCPTLKQVVFGPLMVWHLRALSTRAGECHCELELLSLERIRGLVQMRMSDPEQQVCDWQGRLARLLREGPSGLSEVEIGRIIKPEA
ncbi:hypothetical protein JB92DRAFT_1334317 [Gautieria morchelliformis]|nr:hypothetical protein JB92DRAFT_1334317 [Gautieria morchelliformis]